MTGGGVTWTYTYDANGMRKTRSNGSTTYSYVYNGNKLSQMTAGGNTLTFTYDANGAPAAVTYNGTVYYYLTTLQGDVLMILDTDGQAVVDYTYDAWGRIHSSNGSMAATLGQLNPLRYRGYVYDQETGLYYLNSRYYNPQWGRFLNADAFAATDQGLLGNNMFAYCNNNPVILSDPSGTMAMVAFDNGGRTLAQPWKKGIGGSSSYERVSSSMALSNGSANKSLSIWEHITNSSEQVVQNELNTYGVSFYNGVPVFMGSLPFDRSAFSFGVIVMDDYYANVSAEAFSQTLNHEYGHAVHFQMVGAVTYATTTVFPSLIGAGLSYCSPVVLDNYYSLPWERVADYLGGVNRGYVSGANTAGSLFWIYTLLHLVF